MHELEATTAVVSVTSIHNMFGIPINTCRTRVIVDICPTCATQESEAQQRKRQATGIAIGGVAVVLFGWNYLGLAAVSAVGVLTVIGILGRLRKSKQLTVIPQEGGKDDGIR